MSEVSKVSEASRPVVGTGVRDASVATLISVVVCAGLAFYAGWAATHGAAAVTGIGVVLAAAVAVASRRDRWSGPADRVTLARTVLVGGCATTAVLVLVSTLPPRPWWLLGLAVPALVLDGVDGWVARRTGTSSAAGARLDMEVDAALLLVLSVVATLTVGWWVLAIGLMRYVWVGLSRVWPALRGTPRPRYSRKVIAVVQGAALCWALVPAVPTAAATTVLGCALGLLVFSFARDGVQLSRGAPGRDRHGVVSRPVHGSASGWVPGEQDSRS